MRHLILAGLFIISPFLINAQIVVKIKPLKPTVLVKKPWKAKSGFFWVEGHWQWSSRKGCYVWSKGHWKKRRKGFLYSPGYWKIVGGGFVWISGSWTKVIRSKHKKYRIRKRF